MISTERASEVAPHFLLVFRVVAVLVLLQISSRSKQQKGQESLGGVVPGHVCFDYIDFFCFITSEESERIRRYVLLLFTPQIAYHALTLPYSTHERDSKNVSILSSRVINPLGFNSCDKCARLHHSTLLFTCSRF